jgi:transposase
MDRQTLRDWVHRYNAEGVTGLLSRTALGPEPLLTEQQMAELKVLVTNGPDPEKDGIVRWRCVDLRKQIVQRFSVSFHERSVGKLLRQLGLTRLQPRPYHPKKDPEAEVAFKKSNCPGSEADQVRRKLATRRAGSSVNVWSMFQPYFLAV